MGTKLMEKTGRARSTVGLQDYAKTGSDRSAGAATRAVALIVTAILLPWALLRRGLRSLAAGLRRTASVLARAAQRAGAAMVFLWSLLRKGLRSIVARLRRSGSGLARAAKRGARATVTAILFLWTLLRTGLRSIAAALRRPGSGLAQAARRIGVILAKAVGRTAAGFTAAARGPIAALLAVLRRFGAAVVVILRGGYAALATLTGWAAAGGAGLWRGLRPIGRVIAASIVSMTALLLALGGEATGLLRRCARPLRVLVRNAGLSVQSALSALRTVRRALMEVLANGLKTAKTLTRFVLTPCGRAARALIRSAVGILRLAGRTAVAMARRRAPVLGAASRMASYTVATFRTSGRLLLKISRPVLRSSAFLIAAANRLITATGHRISRVILIGLDRVRRVARALSRVFARLGDACRNAKGRMAEAFAGLSRRTAHGARVATGTARHRANRVAVSGSHADWRLAPDANGSPSPAQNRESEAAFNIEVHQNEYLRTGESTTSAVISVVSQICQNSIGRPEMVEVILLDCSASMGHPWEKILHARRATRAAVAGLPDGVWFAVVRGAESAEVAYPRRGGLVRASDRTRREAFKAIASLQPVGGTAIGRWLSLARELVALRPAALGHALLLTDGKDEDESPAELRGALAECEGAFQCDCRGVGTDWAVEELRRVSTALLGTVDIIREPAEMEADFRAVIDRAMSRGIQASMRIRTPAHGRVTAFRQVAPTIIDLTSRARRIDAQTLQFGLGGWADERREYHLSVDVKSAPAGSEMAACRLAVVVAQTIYSSALVRAIWTDDPELAAQIDPDVAHYTGQTELAAAVQEGLQARREGDLETATLRLRRAVQLAGASANADLLSLLANVVDMVDDDSWTVSIRREVEAFDEMALDTRSVRTVPARATAATQAAAAPEEVP
jgi:von Willebrand factor type A C-terminal domain/von Willebrand factor type A domain